MLCIFAFRMKVFSLAIALVKMMIEMNDNGQVQGKIQKNGRKPFWVSNWIEWERRTKNEKKSRRRIWNGMIIERILSLALNAFISLVREHCMCHCPKSRKYTINTQMERDINSISVQFETTSYRHYTTVSHTRELSLIVDLGRISRKLWNSLLSIIYPSSWILFGIREKHSFIIAIHSFGWIVTVFEILK